MTNEKYEKISVIIPAAGMGRRMKSYGPKPLIKIGNSTIIKNQIGLIQSYIPGAEIILIAGFKADKLMNETPSHIIKIENAGYEETNVVKSIGMGLRASTRPNNLVIYGDLVFNAITLQSLVLSESSLIANVDTMGDREVGCVINEYDMVENIMYDLPQNWGQIAFFCHKELKLLKEMCWDRKNHKKFGFEIINSIIDKGGKFKCVKNKDIKIVDIESSKDIPMAASILT